MTRFSDENIAFEQQQKSRFLYPMNPAIATLDSLFECNFYLKCFTLNLIEIQVDECLKS